MNQVARRKIYLAGPLFTLAERHFNQRLAKALEAHLPGATVVLPQDYASRIADASDFHKRMFSFCLRSITRCDFVVAILDGSDADSGTCIELGYARAKNTPIVGVRTDIRTSEHRGLNLMVALVCDHLLLAPSTTTDVDSLASKITHWLRPH